MKNFLFITILFLSQGFVHSTEVSLCESLSDENYKSCLKDLNIKESLQKLQNIGQANAHDRYRAAGTKGGTQTFEYIKSELEKLNLELTVSAFLAKNYTVHSSKLSLSDDKRVFLPHDDYEVFTNVSSNKISSFFEVINPKWGLGNKSTSGCSLSDFHQFNPGNIALVQIGGCNVKDKINNALKAKASAIIIFNQGNDKYANEVEGGTLDVKAFPDGHPSVISASYEFGHYLAHQALGQRLEIMINSSAEHEEYNLIAETKSGNPDQVVMLGAHYDSVAEGPGINDNGSGITALLEVAKLVSNLKVKNKVRFAWWAAEEVRLQGSKSYVKNLSEEEIKKIRMYLNFDTIASPNYALWIRGPEFKSSYSNVPLPPPGAINIKKAFMKFYDLENFNYLFAPGNDFSDYAPFAWKGIAIGGVFTGIDDEKTQEEFKLFGGKIGERYDPCYHSKCDTIDNISWPMADLNTRAIGYVTITFGMGLMPLP